MSVLYGSVIHLESVGIQSRMCLGVVSLVSVASGGRVVNPTGGNFSISTHKNLVETYAILIISLASLIEIALRDYLIEILYMNLVETLIIIHHLIYCMSI